MKIFNSIQKKLLITYVAIIVLFGGVLSLVLTNSYLSSLERLRENDIIDCAKQISQMFASGELPSTHIDDGTNIPVLTTVAKNFDAEIQVVHPDSKRVIYNIDNEEMIVLDKNKYISDEIYEETFVQNSIYAEKHYDEDRESQVLTVGYPMYFLSAPNKAWAILIINSDLSSVYDTYSQTMISLVIPAVLVAALGLIIIVIITQSMANRIKIINDATQKLARGKLSERIVIKGGDEIGQLAYNFNSMAEEIEKSDRSKRDFVSNAAHELRSPMTSINGFIEGMLDGTIPPEENKKYLEIVLSETKRLTKLVKTMLDLSRIESGRDKPMMAKFDINEVVRRVVIRFGQKIDEKGIIPEIEFANDKQFVYADVDKIEQVLQNLFDNAIKFTPKDKRIILKTERIENKVKITVRDEGIGISEEEIKFIWDRFFTEDKAHTGHKSGTGLGLSIVKSIIEQHNETITVTSKKGEGTAFVFTLSAR